MQIYTNIILIYSIIHTKKKHAKGSIHSVVQFYATLGTIVGDFSVQIRQKPNTYVRVNVNVKVFTCCAGAFMCTYMYMSHS